jgi:hypothetical protein
MPLSTSSSSEHLLFEFMNINKYDDFIQRRLNPFLEEINRWVILKDKAPNAKASRACQYRIGHLIQAIKDIESTAEELVEPPYSQQFDENIEPNN